MQQVGVVERLALAFVDRAGITVPEAGKLGGRPHHLPGLRARAVEPRPDYARVGVDAGDRAGIAIIDLGRSQRVAELYSVADRESGVAMLRREAVILAEFAPLAAARPGVRR